MTVAEGAESIAADTGHKKLQWGRNLTVAEGEDGAERGAH